jgi:cobalt/nickel transport system ATP-binding protein
MKYPLLEARALGYSYGRQTVFQDFHLQIFRQDKAVLLGRNGAGKTTLLHLLMGLREKCAGELRLMGDSIRYNRRGLTAWRRKIGIVFQNADDQLFAPTVEQDVSFGPTNLGLSASEIDERVTAALAALGLQEYRRRSPLSLSGGEKKRVAIAGCLAMHPEILLLDEPMASLDPESCAMLLDSLNRLHESGVTLIVATHDLDFAWRWAKRVILLRGGQAAADGQAHKILKNEELMTAAGLKLPLQARMSALLEEIKTLTPDDPRLQERLRALEVELT